MRYFLILIFLFSTSYAKTITIYVNSIVNEKITYEQWNPTIEFLQKKLPMYDFKLLPIPPDNVSKIKELLEKEEIDFLITQPAIYSELEHTNNIIKILTLANRFDLSKIGSVFITKKESSIETIKDIQGKKVAAVSPLGLGGWLIGYNELYDNGVDPLKDKTVDFLGSQKKIIDVVLNGEYDVGVIRTGILEKLSSDGTINLNDFKIINQKKSEFPFILSTKLFPEWAFAAAAHVDEHLINEVFRVMNNIDENDEAAIKGEYNGWHIAGNYHNVDMILRKFRLGHYSNLPRYETEDIVIITIAISMIALLLFLLMKYRLNKNMRKILEAEVAEKTRELNEINMNLAQKVDDGIKEIRKKDSLLLEQSKLAQMGEMLNMIAHQWRQPLNSMSASAINLSLKNQLDMLDEESIEKTSAFIQQQVQNMSKIIDDFMEFNKPDTNKEFLLFEPVNEVAKMISTQLINRDITLEVNIDKEIKVYHNSKNIEHVLLNLIVNSRDAFEDNKEIEDKKIKIFASSDGDTVTLTVEDNAGGIPKDIINKVFNPYFTTKEQGKGTGIGLYMTKQMVENISGTTINVEVIDKSTLFRIKFGKGE